MQYVGKQGVWEQAMGDTSGTPELHYANLQPGNVVKVTVNLFARGGGFYLTLEADNPAIIPLTPAQALHEGDDWDTITLVALFAVEGLTSTDATFRAMFSDGALSGTGQLSNFTMIAEVIA